MLKNNSLLQPVHNPQFLFSVMLLLFFPHRPLKVTTIRYRNKMLRLLVLAVMLLVVVAKKSAPDSKPSWAKKDIRFYSEADMERLLDQWEVFITNIVNNALRKNDLDN